MELKVNNRVFQVNAAANRTLLDVLRNELGLTGAKEGCGTGSCGACTVLIDGRAVNACLVLAAEVQGRSITTIEGLAEDGKLHPLQQAFMDEGAVQCGFCTPGVILSGKALLDEVSRPSEAQIRRAIAGNLCRCTGYDKIVTAIRRAAGEQSSAKE